MLPASHATSGSGAEAAAAAKPGAGVDARDLPAVLRVAALPEEAVNNPKLEFPGTYNRLGQLTEEAAQPVEHHDEQAEDGEGDGESGEDPLALLEEEFPYLLGPLTSSEPEPEPEPEPGG